jgi:hypothetical protein
MRARLVKEVSVAGAPVYLGHGDGKRWQVRIDVPVLVKNEDRSPEVEVTLDPFREGTKPDRAQQ